MIKTIVPNTEVRTGSESKSLIGRYVASLSDALVRSIVNAKSTF
jgi:hypothetical protein